jgi:undecaprenyl-diphosphatase
MSSRSSARGRLSIPQAIALGALHGPAELLPVSSSGHVALVPWLLRWPYQELDDELRKAFEVALHAGTAAALLLTLHDERDERTLRLLALSSAPPAVAGYALERSIERHLGRPPTIAAGLLAGALAMALADRTPQRRGHADADQADALWLGVAQACALIPGVSRNGATLAAARLRGFDRAAAARLSRHVAPSVIAGATLLKAARLARRNLPAGTLAPFTAGATAAFLCTLGSAPLVRRLERDRAPLPYALYRVALAALVLRRVARERSGRCPTIRP